MIFNYIVKNRVNGKRYVGSHEGDFSDNYLGSGDLIKKAVKKYGRENFQRDVLNVVPTREEAFKNEKFLIEMYHTLVPKGYNLSKTGGVMVPGCFSEGMRAKMSKKRLGKTLNELYGDKKANEWKKNIGDANRGEKSPLYGKKGEKANFYGKHHTEKTKEAIGFAQRGEKNHMYGKFGEESSMYGKKHTKETKKTMSKAKKGKPLSEEHKKALSANHADVSGKNNPNYGRTGDKNPMYGLTGSKNCRSKSLLQYRINGKFIKEWGSSYEAERELGFGRTGIGACARGKYSTAYGFVWKFKETENK